ncbi:zinc-finger domain-containing protein [Lipomyces kononenkoae]|uniref:Zinc-finger domain-containing protein n=1 Tax=Lipomyces kononenkoae TaxID=34357 RepID=A0ACC3TBQ4_LIPKO
MLPQYRQMFCAAQSLRAARGLSQRALIRSFASTAQPVPSKQDKDVELSEEQAPLTMQAPNREETWAVSQRPRSVAMTGPRFAQKNLAAQPRPYAAIELIAEEPIRLVDGNIAVCDGGRGVQGHPKVFINLDQDGPNTCTYCGLRFQQKRQDGH